MKIIKGIAVGILVVSALMLLVAVFLPKEYIVSQNIVINRPQSDVFNYVKIIDNQRKYNVWVMEDPNVKITPQGTDGTMGFKWAWDSKNENVGKGEQEITKIIDDKVIEIDLRFEKPFKSMSKTATTCIAINPNTTKVINEFYGKSSFPLNLMTVFMKSYLGDAMQQNLNNLKKELEK